VLLRPARYSGQVVGTSQSIGGSTPGRSPITANAQVVGHHRKAGCSGRHGVSWRKIGVSAKGGESEMSRSPHNSDWGPVVDSDSGPPRSLPGAGPSSETPGSGPRRPWPPLPPARAFRRRCAYAGAEAGPLAPPPRCASAGPRFSGSPPAAAAKPQGHRPERPAGEAAPQAMRRIVRRASAADRPHPGSASTPSRAPPAR
jgi:hypothetical protein